MKNIEYLALEGGGGKGTAYLSLAKLLEENDQIKGIKGFSGASAGAITTLLLSMEVSYDQMREYIFEMKIFEDFAPKSKTRALSRPFFRCVVQDEGRVKGGKMYLPFHVEKAYYALYEDINYYYYLPENIDKGITELMTGIKVSAPIVKVFGWLRPFIESKKKELLEEFSDKVTPVTLANLFGLGGLFKGEGVMGVLGAFVENALPLNKQGFRTGPKNRLRYKYVEIENYFSIVDNTESSAVKTPYGENEIKNPYLKSFEEELNNSSFDEISSPSELEQQYKIFEDNFKLSTEGEIILSGTYYWSFEELHEVFGKDLYITGSNLVDGETYIFSRETTPDFPVIYAVAISMNLPVWAPIFVSYKNPQGVDYTGWYFDGGLYNNFPIRLFSSGISAETKSKPQNELLNKPLKDNSFGFYVGEKGTYLTGFPNLKSVGSSLSGSLMDKSTFGQFFQNENSKTLALKTDGLSTYNFTPNEDVFKKLEKENEKLIKEFLK